MTLRRAAIPARLSLLRDDCIQHLQRGGLVVEDNIPHLGGHGIFSIDVDW